MQGKARCQQRFRVCSHLDYPSLVLLAFFFLWSGPKKNLPNIQNNAVYWAKCAYCMLCVHIVVFLPVEYSQGAYKVHKGVKTAPEIPQMHTQMKISCKEMEVLIPSAEQ